MVKNTDHSNFFDGVVVATSQIPAPELEKLVSLVEFFGGKHKTNLDSSCTHLITSNTEPETAAFHLAIESGIPVVSYEWVNECVKAKKQLDVSKFIIEASSSSSTTATKFQPPITKSTTQQQRPRSQEPQQAKPQFLKGTVFHVCNYAEEPKQGLIESLKAYGAKVVDEYSNSCTHLLTRFQTGEAYKQAKRDGKKIVTLHWLDDSIEEEAILPYDTKITHIPIRNNDGIPQLRDLKIAISGFEGDERSDMKFLIGSVKAVYTASLSKENTHLICLKPEGPKYTKALEWGIHIVNRHWLEDCVRLWKKPNENDPKYQFKTVSKAKPAGSTTAAKSASKKRPAGQQSEPDTSSTASSSSSTATATTTKRARTSSPDQHAAQPTATTVTTTTTTAAKATAAKKASTTSATVSTAVSVSKTATTTTTTTTPSSSKAGGAAPAEKRSKYAFMFGAGIPVKTLQQYQTIAKQLGGKAIVQPNFSFECTHLIMNEPKRSEKFLCACAAGNWVLKPSYLDDCAKQSKFVNEAPYEWYSDQVVSLPAGKRTVYLWAGSARKWREYRAKHGHGPFKGKRVLIYDEADAQRRDLVEKVIQLGSGEVIPFDGRVTSAGDQEELPAVDYIVVSSQRIDQMTASSANNNNNNNNAGTAAAAAATTTTDPKFDEVLAQLRRQNPRVRCISGDYFLDFISHKEQPDPAKYQPPPPPQ